MIMHGLTPAGDHETAGLDRRFVIVFLLYLIAFLLLVEAPLPLFDWLKVFTARSSASFWRLFSVPVSQSGPLITVFDFPMEITHECTALHYFAIFSAGVLAFRSHPRWYRFGGLLAGGFVIMVLNILRVGTLGMIGHFAPEMEDVVHAYLWQGAFAGCVFFIWFLWVRKDPRLSRKTGKAILLALAASILSLGVLTKTVEFYAALLAAAANVVAGVFSALMKTGLTVSSEGRVVLIRAAGQVLHVDQLFEVFNTAILAALAAAWIPLVSRPTLLRRTALGGVLLVLQHLSALVISGAAFSSGMGVATLTGVLWTVRGVGMVAPMVIWWIVSILFQDGSGGREHADASRAPL